MEPPSFQGCPQSGRSIGVHAAQGLCKRISAAKLEPQWPSDRRLTGEFTDVCMFSQARDRGKVLSWAANFTCPHKSLSTTQNGHISHGVCDSEVVVALSMKPMLQAKNLTKRYGPVLAVSNASFAIRSGAITGFLGPNGAGKSTTMRLFLGLDHPTSGAALIDGKPIGEWPVPARKIGAALDTECAHPARRAIDSVRWAAKLAGVPAGQAEALLDRVGLTKVAGQRAGRFSLGMRQRLALAIALIGNPEIVMLDEPMNGLDPEGITWMKELLRTFRDQGRTVFVSSHLLAELEDLVDDLVVIAQSKIIGSGSAAAFIERFQAQTIRVMTDKPQALGAAVIQAGGQVLDTDGQRLQVTGLAAEQLGELARDAGVAVFGLAEERSLQTAFAKATVERSEIQGEVG
ncbi:ABC transporter ATP-binding protein [Nonomuraea sp. NBC_00507]|uniref:ABC transporter ATP-binding protein n=2 Tax=unclassified Nonomuraea TaxID=2593643 RepID=UPI002E16DDD5